jgi:hypothetical protein
MWCERRNENERSRRCDQTPEDEVVEALGACGGSNELGGRVW